MVTVLRLAQLSIATSLHEQKAVCASPDLSCQTVPFVHFVVKRAHSSLSVALSPLLLLPPTGVVAMAMCHVLTSLTRITWHVIPLEIKLHDSLVRRVGRPCRKSTLAV